MPRVTKSFKPASSTRTFDSSSATNEQPGVEQFVGEGPANEQPRNDYQPQGGGYRPRYGGGGGYPTAPRNDYQDRDVPTEEVKGILEVMPEGHGFLRPKYIPSDMDVYISASQIRRFNLRP